jgi:hypothetical protein
MLVWTAARRQTSRCRRRTEQFSASPENRREQDGTVSGTLTAVFARRDLAKHFMALCLHQWWVLNFLEVTHPQLVGGGCLLPV